MSGQRILKNLRSLVHNIYQYPNYLNSEKEWKELEEILSTRECRFLMKNINSFISIYNYRTGYYEFMSDGIASCLGYQAKEFIGSEGVYKVYSIIKKEHAEWFIDPILKNVLKYLSKNVSNNTGLDYRYGCTLKLRNSDDVYQWYILDTLILQIEDNGMPHRTLITCTNIDHYKKDDLVYYNLMKKDQAGIYRIILEGNANNEAETDIFTLREIEILSYISRGLTNQKIASKLFISIDTVKAHRKNILRKTNCKGTAELLNFVFSRSNS